MIILFLSVQFTFITGFVQIVSGTASGDNFMSLNGTRFVIGIYDRW